MADTSKKLHSRIRTFANDLDIEREKSGMSKDIPEKAPDKKTEEPKPAGVVISEPRKNHHHIPDNISPAHSIEPAPEKIPDVSSKIPAFHELQKQINSFKNEDLGKVDVKTVRHKNFKSDDNTDDDLIKKTVRPNIGYDSTIITDTKSNSFKLFPAIAASVKSWFHNIIVNLKKKPVQKYSVPETSLRKGVIQKATSKTGAFFTADSESLKDQIRMRRQQDKKKDEVTHEPETSWSPNVETGFNLLKAPDLSSNVVTEFKQSAFTRATQIENIPEPTVTEELPKPPADVWGEETLETAVEPETVVQPTLEEKLPTEEVVEPVQVETPVFSPPEIEDESRIIIPESDDDVVTLRRTPLKFININTNILTISLLIIVIGIAAITFTTHFIYQQNKLNNTETTTGKAPIAPLIKGANLLNISLTNETVRKVPQVVKTTIESSPEGLVEIPLVLALGEEATPAYLFSLLNFKTLPSFSQSITKARFATINNSAPLLVMRFVDENTVRGGMLDWEKNMASDMRSIYNIPELKTGDFTDEKIGDTDVRLLRHDNKIIIIYGIVGNTILVTEKVSDFAQIIEIGFSD